MAGSWQASDIFDVIRRLIDDSAMNDREKTMAYALIEAHGSQHVANPEFFHKSLAVHGGLLGLPPGSPQLSKALAEQPPPA